MDKNRYKSIFKKRKRKTDLTIKDFESRKFIRIVKDPIYGFTSMTIPIGKKDEITEHDLIQSKWIQRLRRIKQTQSCYLVFPGMEHTRFQHVMGVMHLAGEFVKEWYGGYLKVLENNTPKRIKELPSINYVEEIFRLAGLFHDIGHGPFSHSLDTGYGSFYPKDKELNHEIVSQLIVENCFSDQIANITRSPSGFFNKHEKINPKMISWLIRTDDKAYKSYDKEFTWLETLKWIISGVYDVDSLDYLVRDSLHAGSQAYGLPDVERLKKTSFMSDKQINLYSNSVSAVENLLYSRLQMYQVCYYHKTVRAFDLLAENLFKDTLTLLDFPHPDDNLRSFLDSFYKFDEYTLFETAERWSISENEREKEIGIRWVDIYNRKIEIKLVFEREFRINEALYGDKKRMGIDLMSELPGIFQKRLIDEFVSTKKKSENELLKQQISQNIINQIKCMSKQTFEKSFHIDTPELRGRRLKSTLREKHDIHVYNPSKEDLVPKKITMHEFLERIPSKIHWFRLYAKKENYEVIKFLGELTFENMEGVQEAKQETNI